MKHFFWNLKYQNGQLLKIIYVWLKLNYVDHYVANNLKMTLTWS